MLRLNQFLDRIPGGIIYLFGAVPALWLFGLGLTNQIGANPINTLLRQYGLWAIQLFIITLFITPLTRWGFRVARFRRPLGLLSFFYAFAHLLIWVILDHGLNLERIWIEITKRPFIWLGMLAFLLMLPLAITSNYRSLRKLGPRQWRQLHKLTYPAVVLALFHYLLVVKGWQLEPIIYAIIVSGLLLWRFFPFLRTGH